MIVVYRHIYNDSVVYIGMGKSGRENDTSNRSEQWHKHVKDVNKLEVDILWETTSRREAYEKEKEFISIYGRKDLNEGTLLNRTDGGGWLKGVQWSDEKRQIYANRARKHNVLKKWQEENGPAVKGRNLPKQTEQRVRTRAQAVKKAWQSKTQEERNLQTALFINNNPSYWVQECTYCGRSIQGASAFKRFHGKNCKKK